MDTKTVTKFNTTLYCNGDISLLDRMIVAVVGKREAPEAALEISYNVGKQLAKEGYVVLNGMALGCDKKAIEGALDAGGKVIAVLPCGVDLIYPSSCKDVANKILLSGGLIVSQYPNGTGIEKYRFVERDKTQALLSNKVISVYCDEKSGTMHTLKFAKRLGKAVGCIMDCLGNDYALQKLNAKKISADTLDSFVNEEETTYTQLSLFDL